MYIKIISAALLLFCSTQLDAQLFINAEGNLGISKDGFGSLGFGKQFKSGLSLRGNFSYGNFGKETGDGAPPYSFLILDQFDFSEVVGYSSSYTGGAIGFGVGYTLQLNDRHSIYTEALGQVYRVTDDLKIDYRFYGGPKAGQQWSKTKPQTSNYWSAGIGVSHQIRLNHFASVYYGARLNYFERLGQDSDYEISEANVMYGFEPTFHAGLRFNLPTQE